MRNQHRGQGLFDVCGREESKSAGRGRPGTSSDACTSPQAPSRLHVALGFRAACRHIK